MCKHFSPVEDINVSNNKTLQKYSNQPEGYITKEYSSDLTKAILDFNGLPPAGDPVGKGEMDLLWDAYYVLR